MNSVRTDTRPPFSVPIDSLGYGKGKEKEGKEVKLSVRPEKWLYIDSYSICIERSSFELGTILT